MSPRPALLLSVMLPLSHLAPAGTPAVRLPDPLVAADGTTISTAEQWTTRRRPELVELFRQHVYGRASIGRPESLSFEAGELVPAFESRARRRAVRVSYASPSSGAQGGFDLTFYYPDEGRPIKGVFILIVNRSRKIITEAETAPREFWPVLDIVSRGYATAAFHYSDVAPDDKDDDFRSGVFPLFDSPERPRANDAWGSIGAWAWGASRAVDYVETDPLLKGLPVAVAGHSRGGKTALWCGAQDERVNLSISNDSGTTGAAIARLSKGETITQINTVFPHWFAINYRAYNDRPEAMPVDQHLLVASIAPRLVYISSASEDAHADPAAEFRSGIEAAPAFRLFGLEGIQPATFPAVGETRHDGHIGYHLRAGKHDLQREDWKHFLDFADRHFPATDASR